MDIVSVKLNSSLKRNVTALNLVNMESAKRVKCQLFYGSTYGNSVFPGWVSLTLLIVKCL